MRESYQNELDQNLPLAPTATLIELDEDGDGKEKIVLYREQVNREGTLAPRFMDLHSLIKFLETSNCLTVRSEEFDLFVNLNGLAPEIDPIAANTTISSGFVNRKSMRDHRKFLRFLGLEQYESFLKHEVREVNGKFFYPVIEDGIFFKILQMWIKNHSERRGQKLIAALAQVNKFLSGSGDLSSASKAGNQESSESDQSLQQSHGLQELWELSLSIENHSAFADSTLKRTLALLENTDRNCIVQSSVCGALQSMVSSDKYMKQRLGDMNFLAIALEELRGNMGSLAIPNPPPAAMYLLRGLSHFATDNRGRSQILSELSFFTSSIQHGASSELVSAVLVLLLRCVHHSAYKVESSCHFIDEIELHKQNVSGENYIPARARRRSAPSIRLQTITVGKTPVVVHSLMEFLRESSAYLSRSDPNFSIKFGAVLLLANIALAAERQKQGCVRHCPGVFVPEMFQDLGRLGNILADEPSKHNRIDLAYHKGSRIDPDRPPQLHSLRELILSSRLVPTNIAHAVRWTLHLIAQSLANLPPMTNQIKQNDVFLSMLLSGSGRRRRSDASSGAKSDDRSDEPSSFLQITPDEAAHLHDQHLYSGQWECTWSKRFVSNEDQSKEVEDMDTLVLYFLFHAVTVLFEWTACLHEQSYIDGIKCVRFRPSSGVSNPHPSYGTVIADKEVDSVFQALAHTLGFLHENWLLRFPQDNDEDSKETLIGLLKDLQDLCFRGLENLFDIPQCCALLVRKFGFLNEHYESNKFQEELEESIGSSIGQQRNTFRCDQGIQLPSERKRRKVLVKPPAKTAEDDFAPLRMKPIRIGKSWIKGPLKVTFAIDKCLTASAEHSLACNILRLLMSGSSGYVCISRSISLEGILDMIMFESILFVRSHGTWDILAASAMYFAYGPIGLNVDTEVIDKNAPLFGKAAEDASKNPLTGAQAFASTLTFPTSTLKSLASAIKFLSNELHSTVAKWKTRSNAESFMEFEKVSAPLAKLCMTIWCVARERRNFVVLSSKTDIIESLSSTLSLCLSLIDDLKNDFKFTAPHQRHGHKKGNQRKTSRRISITTVNARVKFRYETLILDLIESISSSVWLLVSQNPIQKRFAEDLLLHKVISRAFQTVSNLVGHASINSRWREMSAVEILEPKSRRASAGMVRPFEQPQSKPSSGTPPTPASSQESNEPLAWSNMNQVQRIIFQNVNLIWSAVETCDDAFMVVLSPTNRWMLRVLHDCCYNTTLEASTRRRSCVLLSYISRKADKVLQRWMAKRKEYRSSNQSRENDESIGEDATLKLVLDLLDEDDDNLRSIASLLLARKSLTPKDHALIRSRGHIQRLLNFATERSDYERRCALLALLNCAESGASQELIVKHGLYRLLIVSWITACVKSRRTLQYLTSALLSRVSANTKNRTQIYQAELRAKEIAGWFNILDSAGVDDGAHINDAKSKKDDQKRQSKLDVEGGNSIQSAYIAWIKEFENRVISGEEKHQSARDGEDELRLDPSKQDIKKAVSMVEEFVKSETVETSKVSRAAFKRVFAPNQSPLWQYRGIILPTQRDGVEHSQNEVPMKITPGSHVQVLQDLEVMRRAIEGDEEDPPRKSAQHRTSMKGTIVKAALSEPETNEMDLPCRSNIDREDDQLDFSTSEQIRAQAKLLELKEMKRKALGLTFKPSSLFIGTEEKILHSPSRPNTSAVGTGSPRQQRVLTQSDKFVPPTTSLETAKKVKSGDSSSPSPTNKLQSRKARHSKWSPFSDPQTKSANAGFGQRMRMPVKALWEAQSPWQDPWRPRLSKTTANSVTVERDTFLFAESKSDNETPSEFLERQTLRMKRKKEREGSLRRTSLSLFGRVEGSRIYDDLQVYDVLNGKECHIFFQGDEDLISTFLDERELGEAICPMSLFALGRVVLDPKALANRKNLYGQTNEEEWRQILKNCSISLGAMVVSEKEQLHASRMLPICCVVSGFPLLHDPCKASDWNRSVLRLMEPRVEPSAPAALPPLVHTQAVQLPEDVTSPIGQGWSVLATLETGQPETGVKWTPMGRILDDSLDILIRVPGRVQKLIDDFLMQQNVKPKRRRKSIWTAAFNGRRGLLDDNPVAKACIDYDWELCKTKPMFRELLSEFEASDVENAKAIFVNSAPLLISVYRFYCTLTPQNPFALLPKAFLRFVADIGLLEKGGRKFKEECSNLFIKVASSFLPTESLTPAMRSLNERCDPLGLKKSRRLMRHEFLETMLRMALMKYQSTSKSLCEAAEIFLKAHVVKYLAPETVLDFDSWRIRRLYNRNVSNLFLEHQSMLEGWFNELSGKEKRSLRWGGAEKKRMTLQEWNLGLRRLGLFTANFTIRESTYSFAMSTTNVVEWVREWEPMISLSYADFLEALGRVTELVAIPTKQELDFFGVENIVQFYTLMERTNLWSTLDNTVTDAETRLTLWMSPEEQRAQERLRQLQTRRMERLERELARQDAVETSEGIVQDPKSGSIEEKNEEIVVRLEVDEEDAARYEEEESDLPKMDDRPLSEKLRQFLELLNSRQGMDQMREEEIKFWDNRKKMDLRKRKSEQRTPPSTPRRARRISFTNWEEMEDNDPDIDMMDMEDSINAVSEDLETFEISTASHLHEMWRSNRKEMPDGTFEPRIKIINGKEYDIANLVFKDLPDYFKLENLLAAHCACESIRKCWLRTKLDDEKARIDAFKKTLATSEFLESASEEQHEYWLKRNRHHPWVTEEQRGAYKTLSESEKQKDRDIVLAAISVYVKHNFGHTYTAQEV